MSDEMYMMWLQRIKGLGIGKINRLLNCFETAKDVFNASENALKQVSGLSDVNISAILRNADINIIKNYLKELDDKNIKFYSKYSPKYPELLKKINNPPVCIYVLGELPPPNLPTVSIIGSRKSSSYGLTATEIITKPLAKYGVVIVSGMAWGIDSVAHEAAVSVNGLTMAVFGCGVDLCYPPDKVGLKEKIIKNGCIISEYPPGTGVSREHFPARNRIISGLSLATVVVESKERSGTSITVNLALEQGRDVMAVPGNITSGLSRGTNQLIKEGAILVENHEDIINNLNLRLIDDISKNNYLEENEINIEIQPEAKTSSSQLSLLAHEENLVYDCISFEPINIETIIDKVQLEIKTINKAITMLEINALIKRLPGQNFIKKV